MSVSKYSAVRNALALALKAIKTAGGYTTNLLDANIWDCYSATGLDTGTDSKFPLAMIALEGGRELHLPGGIIERLGTYSVYLAVKKAQSSDDSQEMIEDFIADFQRMLQLNPYLGGIVESSEATTFVTDGGRSDPKGLAVVSVELMWQGTL